jgi:signal transduction histidine kinase/HPt (histidine-containing phosphotransfer) domain-containing protein/ActR/RegA family two-component response regulator
VLRNSVTRQVLAIQWIAVTVIVAASLGFAIQAWNAHRQAGAIVDLVDLDRTLFQSAAGIRLEIGTVSVPILSEDDPRDGIERGLGVMAQAAERAEAGLAASTLADRDTLRAEIHAASAGLRAVRHYVDAEAAQPLAEREASHIEPWRMAVYDLAAAVDRASTSVGHDLRALDVEIGELAAIRQMSFTIRDRYSRQCSALRPNVQTDTPLSGPERDRWREDLGAYAALWTQMERIAEQVPAELGFMPMVKEGMRRTEMAQAIMTRTLENLAGSGKPAYDAAAWSQNCITAYASILGIGSHALDLEVAHAEKQRQQAFLTGAAATVVLVLVVVLGVASLYFVRRRLSVPMRTIQTALARLRAGDFDTAVEVPPWNDEPSAIAKALERFRLEALEARRMRMRIDQLRDELVEHAEQVGRAKSQFLAVMSHEIRTPLHGILGITQLLARSPVSEEQRGWVQALDHSGQLLSGIIDGILDFTRLESGRVSVDAAPFALRERIAMVEAAVGPGIAAKGLSFEVSVDPDLPETVVGDAGKLGQILLNLLGNAAKFTETGGVRLSVGRDGDGRLRIVVADTGIGIPPEARSHIFEPFRQAEDSVARRFGGSGLGLAICRGLLDVLGGTIDVATEPGRGSTFTVLFPIEDAGAEAPQAAADAEPLPRLRLLVAEDNPVNALIVRAMLERDGHLVDWVETGEAAVALAVAEDYDVILMDLAMPGLDGATACRRIRDCGHATRSVVPILAVSAGGTSASDVEAGFDARLEKPFRRDELVDALAEAIGLRPRRAERRRERLGAIGEQARDLGIEGARKLVALYLSSQPALVEEAVEAAGQGDFDRTRSLAHRIKGAAAHVGAGGIAEAAATLERAAAAADRRELAAAAAVLRRESVPHFAAFAVAAEAELDRFLRRGQATFSAKT